MKIFARLIQAIEAHTQTPSLFIVLNNIIHMTYCLLHIVRAQ